MQRPCEDDQYVILRVGEGLCIALPRGGDTSDASRHLSFYAELMNFVLCRLTQCHCASNPGQTPVHNWTASPDYS
jgi:hypothetical protein